jgi:hypothetical protein
MTKFLKILFTKLGDLTLSMGFALRCLINKHKASKKTQETVDLLTADIQKFNCQP